MLSFKEASILIYRREGIYGYYRGFLAAMIKNAINAGTYFACLHYLNQMLIPVTIIPDYAKNFTASAIARVAQSTVGNPIIVIKTRLEVLGFNEYTGIMDAVRKMYKNEGLGGFFTGLKVSLIRDVPFSGIFYPIYEFSKKFF